MEENVLSLSDYLAIVKQRKWSLILPFLVVAVLAVLVALLLPPVYKSTATILIEAQEVPDDFVRSSITSYAEQRIQTINQRIMSTTRLLELINQNNLYAELRGKLTNEQLVGKMREDTRLEMINADVIDRRSGRAAEAAIAFSLSYEGKGSPQSVQQVANLLTSLFLEENLKVRARQTEETSQFLEDEMNKVKAALDELDAKIADFKEKNINSLPELLQAHIQSLNNTERAIDMLQEQLRGQKEHEGYLRAQLATVSPELQDRQSNKARLDELKAELSRLKTKFSDEYPDVIKTRALIAELEKQTAVSRSEAKNSLALPDNPAYITLSSQLASTRAEIASIQTQIDNLRRKAEQLQGQVEGTPRVEETYKALLSERDNTQAKYNDLMSKLMDARVSHGMEKEQKGERFTLIDPPRLPEKPFKPNRRAIALIGLVLGAGAGVGLTALREFSDNSVRRPEQLADFAPVLAMVPVILTAQEIARRRSRTVLLIAAAVVAVAGAVAVFHFQVMDLSVLWAKLMRRMAV